MSSVSTNDRAVLHTNAFLPVHGTALFQAFGVFNSSVYTQIAPEKVRIDVSATTAAEVRTWVYGKNGRLTDTRCLICLLSSLHSGLCLCLRLRLCLLCSA